MHHNSPKLCPPSTLKKTHYFKFKNGGKLLDHNFVNTYQQTTSGQNKNPTKNPTMISHIFFSYRKIIQSYTLQNKTRRHSQDPFKFNMSKIQQFVHQ